VLQGLQAWAVLKRDSAQLSDARSRKLSRWNGECGCRRCTDDIIDAIVARRAWCNALKKVFDSYKFVVLPAAQVFPFDARLEWPPRIAGQAIESSEHCWEVTIPVIMPGCPAITMPVGFDGNGLPMGMQIMASHGADLACFGACQCLRSSHALD
jgi:amidase